MTGVESERGALMAVAYRMLGTVADAEDAVQETFARWYRLDDDERAGIRVPGAWLTRVVGRVCLDMLGSARARRERYVGDWLPEPLPGDSALVGASTAPAADPLERVTLDDSVSMALMVVLDRLTPAERVAFVLHEVFGTPYAEIAEITGRSADAARQLASSARRRIREDGRGGVPRAEHDSVVQAFAVACASGDVGALLELLAPGVVLTADGGGRATAARRPVLGPDKVARFLLGLMAKAPDAQVEFAALPGGTGIVVREDAVVTAVFAFAASAGRITEIWAMRNPEKLGEWR